MFCKNCGKEIADGVKFCPECGVTQTVNDTTGGQAIFPWMILRIKS